jgi:tRNA splicing endonuclease
LFLIQQIKRVLDSNLIDINHFFDDILKQNDSIITSQDDLMKIKEQIKTRALRSYLIFVKLREKEYKNFGMHFEFEWYVDKKQQNFIE